MKKKQFLLLFVLFLIMAILNSCQRNKDQRKEILGDINSSVTIEVVKEISEKEFREMRNRSINAKFFCLEDEILRQQPTEVEIKKWEKWVGFTLKNIKGVIINSREGSRWYWVPPSLIPPCAERYPRIILYKLKKSPKKDFKVVLHYIYPFESSSKGEPEKYFIANMINSQ